MNTRICIISDDAERRHALATTLRQLPGTEIAGEIGQSSALRLLAPLAPDLVLLDADAVAINPFGVLQMHLPMPVLVIAAAAQPTEQAAYLALGGRAVVAADQPDTLIERVAAIIGRSGTAHRGPKHQQRLATCNGAA